MTTDGPNRDPGRETEKWSFPRFGAISALGLLATTGGAVILERVTDLPHPATLGVAAGAVAVLTAVAGSGHKG